MMSTVIQRQGVFVGSLVAVLGVLVASPFTLFHGVLPFVVLLIGFGVVMLLLQTWRRPKYPTAYWLGCLAALLILLPVTTWITFAERGWDAGPFYGTVYRDGVTGLEADERLDYRDGDLTVYNRRPEVPPILTYQAGEVLRWAITLDLEPGAQPHNQDYQLSKIEDLSWFNGILRDRIDFVATWTFGQTPGRLYLWKWGQVHRFYLQR
ncbi:MAG: cytochrome d ubiquinol oxidase subunit II [Leptolyngbya sp. RL_3_1]|nr:cytochrome d ubiquinol oxidase subunit II [Leptolyngbya sp. RL_3_1]